MSNFPCSCHNQMEDVKPRYTVSVLDRIKEIFPDTEITENTEFSYSFRGGYEKLEVHEYGKGSLIYQGTYHPEGHCITGTEDGSGVCEYCGTTWF